MNKRIFTLAILTIVMLTGCEPPSVEVTRFQPVIEGSSTTKKIVFIAGADSHAEGEHEHKAGVELLSAELRAQYPLAEVINIIGGWPTDETVLNGADTIVIYGDGGPNHVFNGQLNTVDKLIDDGVGFVALHYAVEVERNSDAAYSMLGAIGGYFETHWSVNPFWEATFEGITDHIVSEGVSGFSLFDEWYFNMRFADKGVTSILAAVPPVETTERWNGPHSGNEAVREMVAAEQPQTVAWAFTRSNGGRGFGYTGGHYLTHWDNPNTRQLIINAIAWTAKDSLLEPRK